MIFAAKDAVFAALDKDGTPSAFTVFSHGKRPYVMILVLDGESKGLVRTQGDSVTDLFLLKKSATPPRPVGLRLSSPVIDQLKVNKISGLKPDILLPSASDGTRTRDLFRDREAL
jgi:hypothetical protein